MRLDLHTHSTASDGQYSPSEVVFMAKDIGLEVLALTDHDTVSGLAEAENEAKSLGIRFIPGIEISSQDSCEIHILGYGMDYKDPELIKCCEGFINARQSRAQMICDYLESKGIETDMAAIKEIAGNELIARPHFAKYLLAKGHVSTRKEAFDRYLDTDEFHEKVNRVKPSCEESIRIIHNAGGKAVLAHPVLYNMLSDKTLEALIKRLCLCGLDGLECFYKKNHPEQTKKYLMLAEKYGLLISCGSDFHGESVKPGITLGMEIDDEYTGKLLFSNRSNAGTALRGSIRHFKGFI